MHVTDDGREEQVPEKERTVSLNKRVVVVRVLFSTFSERIVFLGFSFVQRELPAARE